jgi:hypothetical protein
MTELKQAQLNGNWIGYTDETEFKVQVGRYKGPYKTEYSFKGNLARAVIHYNLINIGNGYKKRLLMPSAKKPILARQFS